MCGGRDRIDRLGGRGCGRPRTQPQRHQGIRRAETGAYGSPLGSPRRNVTNLREIDPPPKPGRQPTTQAGRKVLPGWETRTTPGDSGEEEKG